jgi:hypothetical protein
MKKYRSERKGRRNFHTAVHNTLGMIATEKTCTAEPAVRATRLRTNRPILGGYRENGYIQQMVAELVSNYHSE